MSGAKTQWVGEEPPKPQLSALALSAFDVAEMLRLTAEKMACLVCGEMPCVVILVRPKRSARSTRLLASPGYCKAHVPRAKRKKP